MPKYQPSQFNVRERDEILRLSKRSVTTTAGGAIDGGALAQVGYWTPITNGDPVSPELLFDSNGDCLVGFVPTP
jgi:hypothetical protein